MRRVPGGTLRVLLALVVAVPVLLSAPAPALGARTLALSAGHFDFKADAGGTGEGEIEVINEGDQKATVLVYVADQEVDELGNVSFVTPARDVLKSFAVPASWVSVEMPKDAKSTGNVPYIEMKPGEKVKVRFTFEVPADAPPGDHNSVLFFEMLPLEQQSRSGSRIAARLGSRIKTRVNGDIIERIEVRPFQIDPVIIGDEIPYRFMVINDGNIDKRVDGELQLLDRSEVVKSRSAVVTDTAIYAASQHEFSGELKPEGFLLGRYTVRLVTQYIPDDGGPAVRVVKERSVIIAPPWAIAAFAAVVLLLALWLLWRIAMTVAKRRALRRQVDPDEQADSDRIAAVRPPVADSAEYEDEAPGRSA